VVFQAAMGVPLLTISGVQRIAGNNPHGFFWDVRGRNLQTLGGKPPRKDVYHLVI